MYLAAENYYYTKSLIYSKGELGVDPNLKHDQKSIELPKGYLRRHYDKDITLGAEIYLAPHEEMSISIDNQSESYNKTEVISKTISRYTTSISWTLNRGEIVIDATNSVKYGNGLRGAVARPQPSVLIYGQWRAWNGFLFW